MKFGGIAMLALTAAMAAHAETETFDSTKQGALPEGWEAGITGTGSQWWAVDIDPTAPTPPHVLLQIGKATFSWCVKKTVSLADGVIEVKFKPIRGHEDQAGGLVWRWKDGNNYYVARGNALENNVSLYYTINGHRHTIKYVAAPVAGNVWHTLQVAFAGKRIKVTLDGKMYIDLEDAHIAGPGAVGVWTKADSMTAFDDFAFGPATPK